MQAATPDLINNLTPSFWSRLTLGKRILVATSLSFTVIVVCAVKMWINLSLLEKTQQWVAHTNEVVASTRATLADLIDMETGVRGFAVGGSEQFLEPYEAGLKNFEKHLAATRELVSDNPTQVARFDAWAQEEKKWREGSAMVDIAGRNAVKAGTLSSADFEASFNRAAGKAGMDRMRAIAAEIVEAEVTLLAVREEAYAAAIVSSRVWGSWIIGIAIVGGWILLYLNNRSTQHTLNGIASRLHDASNQVYSAASQVSTASQSLAEGSSEQAASLEETSASLEEINSQARQNRGNAESARDLAQEAQRATENSTSHMREMVEAMGDIQSASNSIAKIVKTIDEIAFQTNILALNAAVEAARAGEAGAGFAVVADEVRNLARRAAQAARETTESIQDSITKSARGADISNRVADSLGEVAVKARQVADLVVEITNASIEQTQGIGQVGVAVSQMDKVTQGNAANAEETAAASQELDQQAASLLATVGQLTQLIGAATTTSAPNPSAPPSRQSPRSPQAATFSSAKPLADVSSFASHS